MFINRLKTVMLLAVLSGLLILFGTLFGGPAGASAAIIIALVINFGMYFFSDSLVLSLYGAKSLDKERYNWVYVIVQELSDKLNIPTPKLWLVDMHSPNAFATGRNPHNSSVAFTSSILNLLEKHELRGVIAHELSHIKNRDILVSTIAATMATAISYLANMAQHSIFWSNNRRKEGNIIGMLIASILLPFASTLLQLAVSRSREYLADETGAYACRDPLALASALEKLSANTQHVSQTSQDAAHACTASLFIVYPFKSDNLASLFSTHPPMRKRIEKLRQLSDIIYS